jgi:hypothetical protein
MDMTQKLPPWYRQFWPWFLMLFPAAAVIGGIITFRMAVTSNDGVVEDDYYKKGMAINRTLARDQAAAAAGLLGQLQVRGDRIALQLNGRLTDWPAQLSLRILHPTRSGMDQTVVLVSHGRGAYEGTSKALGANKWDLVLEDEAKRWRLTGRLAAGRHDAALMPGQ